jgi:VanZ family protein
VGVALATIFVLSSIPGEKLPDLGAWNADKLVHGLEFAGLGLLLARLIRRTGWGRRAAVTLVAAVASASAWGALDEFHQLFTPNRSSDWRDWVADTAGAIVGVGCYLAWRHVRTRGAAQGGLAAAVAAPKDAAGKAEPAR